MNEREAAVHFYEMLTGVFNDNDSKALRYICFAALFIGLVWAGFNYFRASRLADTNTPIDEDLFQDTVMPSNTSQLQRIVELAKTIDDIRNTGANLASTIEGIHNMPFNIDPEGGELNPFSATGSTVAGSIPAPSNETTEKEAPKAEPMTVKMIMTADDGEKIAVVDTGGKKAVVLRRGDEIPGGGGFVRAIRPDGLTVIFNKQEVKYEVPEIPKYQEFQTSQRKSR